MELSSPTRRFGSARRAVDIPRERSSRYVPRTFPGSCLPAASLATRSRSLSVSSASSTTNKAKRIPLHCDATGEDGRGTLMVAYNGWREWVLGAWKLPTERADQITPHLVEVAEA